VKNINLYLGDYRTCLQNILADLIFTSPPYNIGSKSPRNDGVRRLGKYDPKSYGAIRDYPDDLPEDEYQEQQVEFLIWAAAHLKQNGVLVYNHKPRRNGRMIVPAEWFLRPTVRERLVLMEEIIWDRDSTHNHCPQMMWNVSERLYVFRRPEGRYLLNNRKYSDVWRIKRASANGHNAPFPLELAERVVGEFSRRGGLVCDPYLGSGTTAIAAQNLGRRFEGAEILEKYHTMAKERLERAALSINQEAAA